MAHHSVKAGYVGLADRLNRFPQGASPSALLYKILEMLFTEKEANLVSLLPLRPFTAEKASRVWKMDRTDTRQVLDELCGRAILLDIEENGRQIYCLPPPMAGFFEFSLMRVRGDLDQKVLSELYYQYINVEDDFITDLFLSGETRLGRVFVHEPVLSRENELYVLDYEKATRVIKTATHIGISTCYCRHKMAHVGRDCDSPKEICMTFNATASSLVKHGIARRVDAGECLTLLETAYSHHLVQFGDNVREGVNFICNCCGCCCEAMTVARKFGPLHPVHTTNFIPEVAPDVCKGCGECVKKCPVEAMTLVSADETDHPGKTRARVNREICLGCGVCSRACPDGNIRLKRRDQRVITPLNTTHRFVLMAIERGKLHHFIFDNQVLASHRILGAVLGVILKLPPAKQAMASRQVKSVYLETLIRRLNL
ncbi:4Fe-4S dicluster domain-containing protein [Thermodesulfobacteriota bacterium]